MSLIDLPRFILQPQPQHRSRISDPGGFFSTPLPRVVRTGVDDATSNHAELKYFAAQLKWRTLIEGKLGGWLRDPKQLEDEGVDAPSKATLKLAISIGERLRDSGFSPPDSIVCDANGGVVFERREDNHAEVIHIWDDGTAEFMMFRGTKIGMRGKIKVD